MQSKKSVIYYVSVARPERDKRNEADKHKKLFADRLEWVFGLKKSKKIQKAICKVKKVWYIKSLSLAAGEWADWKLNSAM